MPEISEALREGVSNVTDAIDCDVFIRQDGLEALLFTRAETVISVTDQGFISEAPVGDWQTGYEA